MFGGIKKTKCDKCGCEISNNSFERHYVSCNGSPKIIKIERCHNCQIELSKVSNVGGHIRWCGHVKKEKNKEAIPKKKTHTQETKKKQSESRNKYLLENPDKHVWKRNDKFRSAPCEHLKSILRKNGFNFIEEYSPLEKRHFSIDIVFLDDKLGIEINGNQHYNRDGALKPYYQKRHDEIIHNGWRLIEIPFNYVYVETFVNDLMRQLKEMSLANKIYPNYRNQKKQKHCSCGAIISRGSNKCRKCANEDRENKNRPSNDILFHQISVNGYEKTGRHYHVSGSAIKKWIIANGGIPPKKMATRWKWNSSKSKKQLRLSL